jgi:CheY-like chemotaxis protein
MNDPITIMEALVRRINRESSCPSILVVEDDSDYASLVRAWFENLPYDLEFAANGEDAVERLSAKKFNLVWLDLQLPGISGVEVLRCVQDVPTIVVTGYPNSDLWREALALKKAFVLINKPDNLQEMKRILNTFKLHD